MYNFDKEFNKRVLEFAVNGKLPSTIYDCVIDLNAKQSKSNEKISMYSEMMKSDNKEIKKFAKEQKSWIEYTNPIRDINVKEIC